MTSGENPITKIERMSTVEITRPTAGIVLQNVEDIFLGENSYYTDGIEALTPLLHAQAEFLCDRFNNSQNQAQVTAREILRGRRWEAWDVDYGRRQHVGISTVVAPGMFVSVFGQHPLKKIYSSGPLAYVDVGEGQNDVFIDALTNATVNNTGSHPLNALAASTANMLTGGTYCLAYHDGPLVEQASRAMLGLHPMYEGQGKVWWGNDGGSASAFAVHLAEKAVSAEKGENPNRLVVAFKEAYHGNVQNKGGDLTPGIGRTGGNHIIEYPDLSVEVETAISELRTLIEDDRVSTIILEATQGDGGGIQMHPDFFVQMMKLSMDYNVPLIFDEIQSGFGRSGKIFNYEYLLEEYQASELVKSGQYPVNPDNIITIVGKSMTDGCSQGSAVIFNDRYTQYNGRAEGVATFAAFPGTLAASIATINTVKYPAYLDMARNNRAIFEDALAMYVEEEGIIRRTRGNGSHLFVEIGGEPLLYRNGVPVGNHEVAQVFLAERFRILTGTVSRHGLRIHLPINADPVVYHAVAMAVGEVGVLMSQGNIGTLAPILLKEVSGLAGRTVQEI